jgi:hypothetical protein
MGSVLLDQPATRVGWFAGFDPPRSAGFTHAGAMVGMLSVLQALCNRSLDERCSQVNIESDY